MDPGDGELSILNAITLQIPQPIHLGQDWTERTNGIAVKDLGWALKPSKPSVSIISGNLQDYLHEILRKKTAQAYCINPNHKKSSFLHLMLNNTLKKYNQNGDLGILCVFWVFFSPP